MGALENRIRQNKGYDEVGSYIMEKLLYNKLCNEFPELSIISQYSPVWLRPQRIDIFIKDCDLAIEYNGAQHYSPIDFFGGNEGLELRKVLDRRKKLLCSEYDIRLVEITYEEDFNYAFEQLKLLFRNILNN